MGQNENIIGEKIIGGLPPADNCLDKKINQAIKLIRAAGKDGQVVEVAYSGGKDSDVILELTRMAGINYRAIYKNTTIDPPGTIKHCLENHVEIIRPKSTFFQLVEKKGMPNRFRRHCCAVLKEYKILDRVIIGVRKAEGTKRAARYKEPTECRIYKGNKHAEQFFPILDWTDEDVVQFIAKRNLKVHQLYYREDGTIDPKRRLGCMACPLASIKKRREQFLKYPKLLRTYIKNAQKYIDTHPNSRVAKAYKDAYEWMVAELFFEKYHLWEEYKNNLFEDTNYKEQLENYFHTKL